MQASAGYKGQLVVALAVVQRCLDGGSLPTG
jgi:hypothetical protein